MRDTNMPLLWLQMKFFLDELFNWMPKEQVTRKQESKDSKGKKGNRKVTLQWLGWEHCKDTPHPSCSKSTVISSCSLLVCIKQRKHQLKTRQEFLRKLKEKLDGHEKGCPFPPEASVKPSLLKSRHKSEWLKQEVIPKSWDSSYKVVITCLHYAEQR